MDLRKKIFHRTLYLLALLVAAAGIGISFFMVGLNREQRKEHYGKEALFMAGQSERLLLWDDRVALRKLLADCVSLDPAIEYSFIEREGLSDIHTFHKGIPKGLLFPHHHGAPLFWREVELGGSGMVYDISARAGASGAFLHLGVSRGRIDRGGVPALITVAAVCALALLLLVYPALRTAKAVTREVDAMTLSLKDMNRQLETKVAARTAELSEANASLGAENAERRRAEEEVRELNRRLESRVAERTADLEAANAELESFSFCVAHDLKSPLRAMDGLSQMLWEDYSGSLDGAGRDYLDRIRAVSRRMSQMIDHMLELSRLSRSKMTIARVDLSKLARETAAALQEGQPARAADFIIEPGLAADADEQMLRIALENLLGNAWKFTSGRPRARIEFGLTRSGGCSAYLVRDNGIGFDMACAGKLFRPFQRLHKSSEFACTGVGLALVNRIIRRLGGRVWGEGVPGKGATFYFTLIGCAAEKERDPGCCD